MAEAELKCLKKNYEELKEDIITMNEEYEKEIALLKWKLELCQEHH